MGVAIGYRALSQRKGNCSIIYKNTNLPEDLMVPNGTVMLILS